MQPAVCYSMSRLSDDLSVRRPLVARCGSHFDGRLAGGEVATGWSLVYPHRPVSALIAHTFRGFRRIDAVVSTR